MWENSAWDGGRGNLLSVLSDTHRNLRMPAEKEIQWGENQVLIMSSNPCHSLPALLHLTLCLSSQQVYSGSAHTRLSHLSLYMVYMLGLNHFTQLLILPILWISKPQWPPQQTTPPTWMSPLAPYVFLRLLWQFRFSQHWAFPLIFSTETISSPSTQRQEYSEHPVCRSSGISMLQERHTNLSNKAGMRPWRPRDEA